jgi:hypothetical protein
MAPAAAGNLVALDFSLIDPVPSCLVERYDPTAGAIQDLFVTWNATQRPPGFVGVVNGTAYVAVPPGYVRRRYPAEVPNLIWRDKAFGTSGLMLIVVLPPGFAVSRSEHLHPLAIATKLANERQALYWRLGDPAEASLRVESTTDVAAAIRTLGDALVGHPLEPAATLPRFPPAPKAIPEPPEWQRRRRS